MTRAQLSFPGWEPPVTFAGRTRLATTFQGKLLEPVHRWFRLTPSFSPELARDIFDHFGLETGERVLDPYSGTGTVPLEARRRGNNAIAVEINPGLHLISQVKTSLYEHGVAAADLTTFEERWRQALERIGEPNEYLAAHPALIPGIAYAERWWAPGTLAQLAAARSMLAESEPCTYPDLVRFAIGSIVMEVSAAKHNHPSMSFADGPAVEKNAVAAFERRCAQILEDIAAEPNTGATVRVYRGNTKTIASVLAKEPRLDVLVTSPPYPNRFSYARETRPFLFFLDLVKSATEVGDIEVSAMGGTWGKATWVLQKSVEPANEALASMLAPFLAGMDGASPILKHYVIRYFNDLWVHAQQISVVMAPRARMAWVIGNAKIVENEVHTDHYLAAIFGHLGWRCDGIVSMRKRHSKRGLHESVVFLSRP